MSAAGGVHRAPERAQALGCEAFQFFSRSPRGGSAPPIPAESVAAFRAACRKEKFESYIHAPYIVNFASSNKRIAHGSVAIVREELARGTLLGATYVMTHIGSARDLGGAAALKHVVERVRDIFDPKDGGQYTTKLLLENSAGAGGSIGSAFEELAFILQGVGRPDIGVCLDSCHCFAAGYDLRTPEAISATMALFTKHIPLSRFKLLHANDSKFGIGQKKDRHADIGDGELGVDTFRHLLAHPAFRRRNMILETPGEDTRRMQDVALLKRRRDESSSGILPPTMLKRSSPTVARGSP